MSSSRKVPFHVGWQPRHPDASMDFQLSRWAAYGGARWLADLGPEIATIENYERGSRRSSVAVNARPV
jgi:hypothetical protein